MDRLKGYIDCYVPTETCNFNCHYCYISSQNKFSNKIFKLEHDVKFIRKALSIERLGGIFLLNLCAGGETLLSEEVLCLTKELLEEGHYVSLVTNGSITRRFEEIAEWDEKLKSHIMIKFSFHYLELVRLNMLEVFFSNVKLMHESGCSITVEITPNDELIPYIPEIKEICMKKLGTLCHITIARNDLDKNISHLSKLPFEKFIDTWKTFNSELFDFKSLIFYKKRKEFCYAGIWTLYLNISSGELKQCLFGNCMTNIYKDITAPIDFCAVGNNCEYAHCYNGHVYLTLGAIPELNTPTYLSLRDRIDENGRHWIKKEFADFISQKLIDNNREFSENEKKKSNRRYMIIKIKTIVKKAGSKLKKEARIEL